MGGTSPHDDDGESRHRDDGIEGEEGRAGDTPGVGTVHGVTGFLPVRTPRHEACAEVNPRLRGAGKGIVGRRDVAQARHSLRRRPFGYYFSARESLRVR